MQTALVSSVVLAAGLGAAAPGTPDQRPVPTSVSAAGPGPDAVQHKRAYTRGYVRGPDGRLHESPDSYSAQRRRAQEERAALRDKLGWATLPDDVRLVFADQAVGPDQLDARGNPFVSFAWLYTKPVRNADHEANDLVLHVDGDVVVVGSDTGTDSDDPAFSSLFVTELDGAINSNWTENWERSPVFGGGSTGWVSGEQGTADLFGNTYVCGKRNNDRYALWKLNEGDGSTVWNKSNVITGGTDATAMDVAVDPEGVVYVCGTFEDNGVSRWFVARHDPSDGTQDWVKTPNSAGVPVGGIEVDRRGYIYVAGYSSTGGHQIVKIDAYDGSTVWNTTVPNSGFDDAFIDTLKLDFAGNPHFAGRVGTGNNSGWQTSKLDTDSGAVLWTETTGNGTPNDLEIDRDGNVYVVGTSQSNTFRLRKYDNSGGTAWTTTYGTAGQAQAVALDSLGNPYVAGRVGAGNNDFVDTRKFDRNDGAEIWRMEDTPSIGAELNRNLDVKDILVDAGGGVYVAGRRYAGNPNTQDEGAEFFTIKYTQPFEGVPLITLSYPNVRIEDRSIWDPENNTGLPAAINISQTIIDEDSSGLRSSINSDLSKTVNYSIGSVTGGVTVEDLNARAKVEARIDIDGGTFDAGVTGELLIAVPESASVNANQPLTIVIDYTPDEMGTELLANSRLGLAAGLFAEGGSDIRAKGTIDDSNLGVLLNNNMINEDDAIVEKDLFGNDFFDELPDDGGWTKEKSDTPDFKAKARLPLLDTEGVYDPATSTLISSVERKFFDGYANVTNLIAKRYLGKSLSYSFDSSGSAHTAKGKAGLAQAEIDGEIAALQDIVIELKPYVILAFSTSGGTTPPTTGRLYLVDGNGAPQSINHVVTMPSSSELTINPTFGVEASFTQESGVAFDFTTSFDALEFDGVLSIKKTTLIDRDKCFGCISDRFQFDIVPATVNASFDFPNEAKLSPVQVFGNTNSQPQLSGASRESGRMLIYDQSNPSQSQLNSIATGVSPMILYGDSFLSNTSLKVKMSHHGKTENLTRTRINNRALLVEVPNRFFLLPGTARIWIENDNGVSESIDFEIEYPFPNFGGLVESFWASDPRWLSTPVVAIDNGTPAGNDSFIARRDYYTLLESTLWNPALIADYSDPNQPISDVFPDFPAWSTFAEPSPPGFPALVIDGVSISRDPDSPNDGAFRAFVPEGVVKSSKSLSFAMCNPGPGGGLSRPVSIDIPAPKPVIGEISPSAFFPGEPTVDDNGNIRLNVFGPETVPYFDGFESAKFGNFTARSVVYMDNNALPTKFVGPGHLVARIPAFAIQSPGTRIITVTTPNPRNISYQETLTDGGGNVVFDDLVESGGTSVPMTLEVRWPRPIIESISHNEVDVMSPPEAPLLIDGVPPADNKNITVLGENFAPGAVVSINGSTINTTRESSQMLRARLTASDIPNVGEVRLTVVNPAPSLRESASETILVVLPAP